MTADSFLVKEEIDALEFDDLGTIDIEDPGSLSVDGSGNPLEVLDGGFPGGLPALVGG